MEIYNLANIRDAQEFFSIIVRRRVTGSNSKIFYVLEKTVRFLLSNNEVLTINKGYKWDLSSVPRILWGILPPDGDFEVSSLIHDALYDLSSVTHGTSMSRKFADEEMLLWSKAVSGTINRVSMRNIDNQIRYIGVRLFAGGKWDKLRKVWTILNPNLLYTNLENIYED